MDIDLLSKMVKELLLDNDKVVLPGLGAFVAEIVPSTFTDKGYTINPPYRRLYFRSRPDEGDSLAMFYASSNRINFDVADKVIRDFVAELKNVLYVRKTVVFPGLGRMRATKENAVFFVADEDLDIYPEGMGLEPVSLKTHQETKEEVFAEPELVIEVEPVAEPEPVVEETPVVQETVAEQDKEQDNEQEIEQKTEQKTEPEAKKNGFWKTFLKTIAWIILVAILLVAAFVAVSRLCPQFIDRILYTPEELEILIR